MNPIDYDFESLGTDKYLIRNNPQQYCLKQVYKMCYYLKKMHNYEIIQMKCQFAKDDNSTIWFQYAEDIYVR